MRWGAPPRAERSWPGDGGETGTEIFDRSVPGRLVLLTCTGAVDPVTRHYDHNLVVPAAPLGVPTPG